MSIKSIFHREWGKAHDNPDYDKKAWMAMQKVVEKPALFQGGCFTLHSGQESDWIIDCNSLTDEDWQTLAHMAYRLLQKTWARFGIVEGVPTGGLKFAEAMRPFASCACGHSRAAHEGHTVVDGFPEETHCSRGCGCKAFRGEETILIVDDVLTTGKSMKEQRGKRIDAVGIVVFARGPCPAWIRPLFTCNVGLE